MADLNAIVVKLDALSTNEREELVGILEDRWNVVANPYKDWMPPDPPDEKPAVKTEFDVELTSFESTKKISVIKALRGILGTPLRDTKEFVESAPRMIKEGVAESDAEEVKRILEDAGATVTIL